ncbi:efflux RND transporter permease subunit [Thalassomonas actiniarum]|uniref:Efflux RND transporter permease subunit n=1 Tax=Thalassomonas actiniarum TaxID=485447 RepID=A0AAE9YPC7_9GAMM|nr:efflux RND transporter permease subunit [Thalassomonas actiniarum]WDD98565.1 efflux RND transporter permease subunit [Thalassomonas actiniarum]
MKLIDQAVRQPITVTVAVVLSILAGIIAFSQVPVQMTPTVDSVVVSVNTFWENASPNEIESDIITEQEQVLGDVTGLASMTSISQSGSGSVRLEFETGTDINLAMQSVLQKLDEVPAYPRGVSEPVVEAVDPDSVDYIAWVGLAATDPNFDATTLYDFMELRLRPRLERIKGVSKVGIVGARERELQIRFDPVALANRGITYAEFINAIQVNNQNYSGGKLQDGKNDIRVRAVGRFTDINIIKKLVIRRDQTGPVYLEDVASVTESYKEMTDWVRSRGILMPFFNFQLQYGANLLETMTEIKAEIRNLNAPDGLLAQHAKKLGINGTFELIQPWDSSTYVERAIDLVQSNILIGGLLATLTLLLFLRSFRTIGVIAIAIPISVIASVVVLVSLGRSINIVSLAGMAFAVGMVIDNAIVVIENIFRHLEMGKKPWRASIDGTKEVASAVFASTLTTLVVFLPILFIQDSAGQLFRDIALAIMAAVSISFVVSVLVIPAAASSFLRLPAKTNKDKPASKVDKVSGFFNALPVYVSRLVAKLIISWKSRITVVVTFAVLTFAGIWALIPPLDYLPKGNRNAVFGVLIPPPGYSLDQMQTIAKRLEGSIKPAWEYTGDKFVAEAKIRGTEKPDPSDRRPELTTMSGEKITAPALDHYFVVAMGGKMFQGALPANEVTAVDTIDLFNYATYGAQAPDVISFAFQFPLFLNGGTTGSAIKIDLVGDDLELVSQSATALMFSLMGKFGPYGVVPEPANFLLPTPELRVTPDDERLQEMGMNRSDVGMAVAANGDGYLLVRGFEIGGELKDIKIISQQASVDAPLDALMQTPVATPAGNVVDLENIARLERVQVADQIKHADRQRAVTLQFTPPNGMAMEDAIATINTMVAELRTAGQINPVVDINLSGSAGKLNDIKQALMGDGTLSGFLMSSLFLALVVVYLVMAVLFQNWLYPVVIMVTVPLATLGGFAGLSAVHSYSLIDRYTPIQNMDVLTIIGFVILAGVVVNNAILIVHQAINLLKGRSDDGTVTTALTPQQAVVESVKSRVRPILMSTLTSVGGMLPLVLMPGAGSELYRGLGAVVVGGLLVSTIFTMFLVPVILSMIFEIKGRNEQTADGELEAAELATAEVK